VGRAHIGEEHLIYDAPCLGSGDVPIVKTVRGKAIFKLTPCGHKKPVGDSQGLWPAEAHDANPPLADGSGDGGNGVVEGIHERSSSRRVGACRRVVIGTRDAGDECLDALVELAASEQDVSPAAMTLEADVGPDAQHVPFVAPTGMGLA